MDMVLVPRETFQYSEAGRIEPLLTDNRAVLFLQISGSMFSLDKECQQMEFAYRYLDMMFAKMGFKKRTLIRVEGKAICDKEAILQATLEDFNQWQVN